MAANNMRDMTVEEFYDWSAAKGREAAIANAADEPGGPRLSLVERREHKELWPTDLLPPSAESPAAGEGTNGQGTDAAASDEPQAAATPFDGVALPDSRKRLAGWSAERQRAFLATLAETGSVHLASGEARLSARSAYRLRTRSPAFAAAWDTALQLAVGRLAAIVFDRAINGRVEQVYQGGTLVAERQVPSDKLLTWLLARLDPRRFALPWEQRGTADSQSDRQSEAAAAFPALLDSVADVPA